MVKKAIINIDDHTNRILNIVKAKYGLKDKSAAIIKIAVLVFSVDEEAKTVTLEDYDHHDNIY